MLSIRHFFFCPSCLHLHFVHGGRCAHGHAERCVSIVLTALRGLIVWRHAVAVFLRWYMVHSILHVCSITDEARFLSLPSGPLSSKEWRLLTSSDRLQPIKCARYHPLITATTSPRNRPDQETAVDVKLTQIHQDEFPFFTSLISSHQQRPTIEPRRLSHPLPVRYVLMG